MNSVIVLCVGMLGAANPGVETQNHQPVQVAANYSIAPGGCYNPAAYRSPLVQNVPVGYSAGTANCANGRCAPVGTASYNTRPYTPVSYSNYQAGTAYCPNGQCQTHSAYRPTGATCFGSNCPQQTPGSYYPSNYDSRYNTVPGTRFPASGYSQPRINPYPAQRPVDPNWPSTYRTLPVNYNQSSTSPFFN